MLYRATAPPLYLFSLLSGVTLQLELDEFIIWICIKG